MRTAMRKTSSLTPYEKNPRVNDAAVDAVAHSIKEFGFRQPIVVTEAGEIICGHTRWKAALKLGLEKVPVHVVTDLTPAKIKALRIADNKTASLSDWDFELLPIELAELKEMDVELELLGFSSKELEEMLGPPGGEGLTDPDEVPEPPAEPVTKPGELWVLGDHRLLCGDATKAEDVERLMAGKKAALVFTDPPYGIAMAPTSPKRRLPGLTNDALPESDFEPFLRAALGLASDQTSGAMFVCCDWRKYHVFRVVLEEAGRPIKNVIVWNKQTRAQNLNRFAFIHEVILYSGDMGPPTADVNVWECGREYSDEHLTPKPVDLLVRAIKPTTKGREIVLDPFLGSGSTLIAAESLNRRCYGLEIEPRYCDVIVRRWEEFTGRKATREASA